jgi:hypothetical protein
VESLHQKYGRLPDGWAEGQPELSLAAQQFRTFYTAEVQ